MRKTQGLMYKLGTKIRTLRKRAGLTQEQLAEAAEVSVNFIGYVERGERSVSIKTLEQIAVALNVMPRNLFEFSEGDIDELTFEAHLNEARSLTQGDLRVLTNLAARLNRHQVMNAAKSARIDRGDVRYANAHDKSIIGNDEGHSRRAVDWRAGWDMEDKKSDPDKEAPQPERDSTTTPRKTTKNS